MTHIGLVPMDMRLIEQIARIFGKYSAAADVLQECRDRKAAGEFVRIYCGHFGEPLIVAAGER